MRATMAAPVAPAAPVTVPAEDEVDGRWWVGNVAFQLLLVAGLAGAATSGWLRLGEGSGPAAAIGLGSVAPPALALGASALRRRPWPSWMAALGHAALLTALAGVVAGGGGEAVRALSGGWARLLSTILPAPAGSEVEVLALAVAGVTSAVGAELALRCRGPATPVAPAVLALVATRMATQGVADARLTGAAAAVALVAGALALTRAGVIRPGLGIPVVVVSAVVAAAAGPGLPWAEARTPFDPRALRHLPPVEAGVVNPLARIRAWQLAPQRVLFRATVSGPTTFRLAVLDRYDGERFAATGSYIPAGTVLPPAPPGDPGAGAPTRRVKADLVIAGLDGPWVPAPDRPARVSGPAVAVDPETGVVVVPGGVRAGQRYQVVAEVPTDRLTDLPNAEAARPELVGDAVAASPPGLPPELASLAAVVAGDPADRPLARLGRLQELFRTGFNEDPSSPPGHSLAQLAAFLDPEDRVGSVEQLATAFAVLARSLGYPSRVAVGFRTSGGDAVEVRGADAHAWPEVALAGVGWVAFDPMPPPGVTSGIDRRPPEAEAAAAAQAASAPPVPPQPGPGPPGSSPAAEPAAGRPWLMSAGALALVVVVAGLVPLAVVHWKRRRRRVRRGASDAGARVRGAWAEASDRLLERGLRSPPSRTPRDVAGAVAAVSSAAVAPLADLGELAERAAFAGPGGVGVPEADRAWADLDLLEAALSAEDGRVAALLRVVDPRPLSARS